MPEDFIPTTTVVPCSKCGTPARLSEGEDSVRCESCLSVVARPTGGGAPGPRAGADGNWERAVMMVGVAILALGLGVWAFGRRHPPPAPDAPRGGPPSTKALTIEAPPSEPVLEIAWVAEAKGPAIAHFDDDATEDLFGFFRVWDGRSAWTMHAGAFTGTTLAPLWRTEPLDPWIVRKSDAPPMAAVVGKRVVLADGTEKLRVYALSGAKEATYLLNETPRDLCPSADNVHLWIDADTPMSLDVSTGAFAPAPAPAACQEASRALHRTNDAADGGRDAAWAQACRGTFDNRYARATCLSPSQLGAVGRSDLAYALVDGDTRAAFARTRDASGQDVAHVLGWTPAGKVLWERPVADAAMTVADTAPPRVAEVANKTLYVVYARKLFDARVEAVDALTGRTLWDVPLVASLPPADPVGARGGAARLVATESRLYVARSGGGLDVFDAHTGAPIGTIGNGAPPAR